MTPPAPLIAPQKMRFRKPFAASCRAVQPCSSPIGSRRFAGPTKYLSYVAANSSTRAPTPNCCSVVTPTAVSLYTMTLRYPRPPLPWVVNKRRNFMGFIMDGLEAEAYDRTYSDRSLIARIIGYFRPKLAIMIVVAILIVLTSLLDTAFPILISRGIDILAVSKTVQAAALLV